MNLLRLHLLLVLLVFSSCSKRNLVYFSDIEPHSNYSVKIPEMVEPTSQTDDLLSITVTSLSPESNLLFNSGVLNAEGDRITVGTGKLNEGYLVVKDGQINFPVLGKVKLAGFTKPEAVREMTIRLEEYVK